MEEAIAKAGALIEAMEYIRQFREKIVVVKLGGSILDDTALQKKLTDILHRLNQCTSFCNCFFHLR